MLVVLAIGGGHKNELIEIVRIVTGAVGRLNSLAQGAVGVRSLTNLISVVVDVPVGTQFQRHFLLPAQQALQLKDPPPGQGLDADDPVPQKRLGDLPGTIGGAVINQINRNALLPQVAQAASQVKLFVVNRHEGDDFHIQSFER